jgi:hypothetical protein
MKIILFIYDNFDALSSRNHKTRIEFVSYESALEYVVNHKIQFFKFSPVMNFQKVQNENYK